MQTTLTDLDGNAAGDLELPDVFETPYRPDLISRAVTVALANRTQPHGAEAYAGQRSSAESMGTGFGRARVPRANNRAAIVPQAVGGRRAHPPKPETDRGKDMNEKERQLATRSAIAATADADRVAERGHEFGEDVSLPIVLADDFESVDRTQAVVELLEAIGLAADIERADAGRSIRAGQGKRRGRKYRQPKSILFVTSSDAGPSRGARNLAGADVATAQNVDVEDLAPGGLPGRLTVWTEAAIAEVAER